MVDVTLDDVEAAMLTHTDPVLTVSDLDDSLDCSDRHILTLLRGLEHTGVVHSKQIGARAVAWWHTTRARPPQPTKGAGQSTGEDSHTTVEQRDDASSSSSDDDDGRQPQPSADTEAAPATDEPPTTDEIEQAIDAAATNWEDSDERIDARKTAARAVLSALRERPLSKSEIIEEFYPEYHVDGQSEETWWRKNLAECNPAPLKHLADYNPGTHKWEM